MIGIGAFPCSTEPQFVEHPLPRSPRAGEVLCRTVALGVCGTDRDILESTHPIVPAGELHLVLGHECLGRVVEVGEGVRDLSAGDLVVPVVRRPRDESQSRPDLLPWGTFTERGIVHEHGFSVPYWLDQPRYLFPVSAEIANVAVLTEPLSVAEKGIQEALAVQRGRLGPDAWRVAPPRVLVTGQGPIAFASLIACRSQGWPTVMLGRDAASTFRSQLAQRLGAAYCPADRFEAEHVAVNEADIERSGFDLILECTGSDLVLVRTASALATCGVMVWLGSSRMPEARLHNLDVLMRNAVLRNHIHLGTVNAAPRDFALALRHLGELQRTCPLDLAALLTDHVPQQDALWHYRHRAPQGIKTVVMCDSP